MITRKGIVAVGSLVGILAWAIAGYSILSARQAATDHARIEAENLAAAFAVEDERIIDGIARTMDAVVTRIRAARGPQDFYSIARDAQLLQPQSSQVAIIGPNGWLLASSLDPDARPIDLSDREHFRVHLDGKLKGIFISKPVVGKVSNQVTVQLTRRVEADDGTFLGIIVFAIPPAAFAGLQNYVDIGARDVVVFTRLDNTIIARFTRDHPDGVFAVGESVAGDARPSTFAADTSGHYIKKGAVDRVERMLAYRRVGQYPVVVTVGLDLADALAQSRLYAFIILGFTGAATVLFTILGGKLIREVALRSKHEIALQEERTKLEAANATLIADNTARIEAEWLARESEGRFRDYAASASDWFWETDPDGRFSFVSERLGEVAGIPAAQLIGKTRATLRQEAEDDAAGQAHLDDLLHHRLFRDVAYRLTRPDGEVRHIRVSGTPVFSGDGGFLGYRGTGRDVTATTEAQAANERLEQRLRESIEALAEGFALFDANERLVLCNSKFLDFHSAIRDVMVPGAQIQALIRESARLAEYDSALSNPEEWITDRLARFRNPGEPFEQRLADGRWCRHADYRTTAGGTICLRTDITAQMLTESGLREAKDAAEAANVAKSQFLANMSHELRTPLNAIIGFSEALELGLAGPLQPKQVEYIEDVHNSGQHLLNVINDILDLAKIDAGKFELHEESSVDPRSVVASCIILVKPQADAGSVYLSTELEDRLPLLIADPTRLKQVLLNLLSNAIKFSKRGASVTVAVRCSRNGDVTFEVRDTGLGMTTNDIEIALQPFGQVEADHARRYEGTGLGLPLARRLAELHGGSLRIASEKGHGTTVTVTLPVTRALARSSLESIAADAVA